MTWQHRVIFNHCEFKWSNWYFSNFISLMTLNWWWNKPTYGSAAIWTQPWLFILFPTFLSFITLHCALWTQPRLTKIFHHDGPTAAFNIHLESSFGVGSQWQLKWTVNQLFTWLTNFIAMGPRPHSTSSWKLSYGHSHNSAVHHMMVNLPMLKTDHWANTLQRQQRLPGGGGYYSSCLRVVYNITCSYVHSNIGPC